MTPRVEQTLRALQPRCREPYCAYVYDLEALRRHAGAMRAALPAGCELFYAAKANPEAPVLRALRDIVDGFEAASGGELAWLQEQVPGRPLIFGGPGKLESELRQAVEAGVDVLHVESVTELHRLARAAAEAEKEIAILLRMNIALEGICGTRLMMGGRPTPFGLDESELPEVLRVLANAPGVSLRGFHFHLMSHQLDVENHLALLGRYLDKVDGWCRKYGLSVSLINVGGGIGINYLDPDSHFDWPLFCQRLPQLTEISRARGWTLRFECGRYVAAPCGYYVMEVLDVKKNLGEWFAIGRGGTHHFRTPAAQGHSHPFSVLRREQNAPWIEDQPVTLVGQLCTPKDVLARQQPVAALAPGDWLVFSLAGAYAWNISHQRFLMHAPPEVQWLGE